MVTGALPFQGDTPLSIAVKRLKEAPPPPTRHFSGVPVVWEKTILRCLEREPANRFQSASDVTASLGGERVGASPRTRRRRLLTAAAAVVVLAFVGAGMLLIRRRSPAPVAAGSAGPVSAAARRSVAVLGFKNLSARP